jgi:hypothetical protein
MSGKTIITIIGFILAGMAGIGILATGPLFGRKKQEQPQTRIIIPHETNGRTDSASEQMAWENSINPRVPMHEGEIIVSILEQDFDGDPADEQIVAYRNLLEIESPVYITFIDFDEQEQEYKRIWTVPTSATRPGTISLFTADLIGDRGLCVILTGMNGRDEHTMTVFRRMAPWAGQEESFPIIAAIRIDGSITIQEQERSQAYHRGIAGDASFTIAAYSHNTGSANPMDQTEIVYAFVPETGRYEESRRSRIPGSQIEQRRLRELLSGERGVFESFINDLWYYVSPQGTVDQRQYIYFDPAGKEIIFFGDGTQQVFTWQNANPTRYGLYIASQNISVTTLRRFLDIELESLESIRIKVFEDVRLKIAVSASWDGSYRRANTAARPDGSPENAIMPAVEALYDSALGKLRLYPSGDYELGSGSMPQKGRYVFFRVNGQELLEFRPEAAATARTVYRVDNARSGASTPDSSSGSLSLSRVRLGATGIQDLHEGVITLTVAAE